MPKTSGSCPSSPDAPRRTAGFTLLELLLVLALMALLTGLVAPAALRAMDAAQERGAVEDLQALLQGLPVRAFGEARRLSYGADELRAECVRCPSDWAVEVEVPLQYDLTGVASGGVVRLAAPGRAPVVWQVAPVSGRVTRIQEPSS